MGGWVITGGKGVVGEVGAPPMQAVVLETSKARQSSSGRILLLTFPKHDL
jgi:hypothetical protein